MSEVFAVNSNISHYRIISKIGAGGLVEMYPASATVFSIDEGVIRFHQMCG